MVSKLDTVKILTSEIHENRDTLKNTYLKLRTNIGILGISLPIIVWLIHFMLTGEGVLDSISAYYHTEMRNVFVGILSTIGFFLLTYDPAFVDPKYRGQKDHKLGLWAGLSAILAAIFPTAPNLSPLSISDQWFNVIHMISASLLFMLLIYFSIGLFTLGDTSDPAKQNRNNVYIWSGIVMAASILLMAIYWGLDYFNFDIISSLEAYSPIFWLEGVALIAFGIAWFVKGQGLRKLSVRGKSISNILGF